MADEAQQRPSVLLLEDDSPMAEMVIANLKDEFDIEHASNADEAKLLLGARHFDILLCDHMMPGGQQGLDFLVEARDRFPKSQRILLTGYMNPDLISRSVSVAGLSACLMKPLGVPELRSELHLALSRRKPGAK